MKRTSSLEILHRYREHLLHQEQIELQMRIAVEREEQVRLHDLQRQITKLQSALLAARTVQELIQLDQSASYLQARKIQASRAVALAKLEQERAMSRTLKAKQACDQIENLLANDRRAEQEETDAHERLELDDLVTSRHRPEGENYA